MRNLISIFILIALILMTLPYEKKSMQSGIVKGEERLNNIEETKYSILDPNPRKMLYGNIEGRYLLIPTLLPLTRQKMVFSILKIEGNEHVKTNISENTYKQFFSKQSI